MTYAAQWHSSPSDESALDIAIVGMAAHLPGAPDIAAFWDNLRAGVESIRPLTRDELLAAGESPALIDRADYVPAAAPLDGFDHFDPDFFGLSPKEAAIMDPQHRQFLEVAWEAMENAAHPPEATDGRIGVFAGCGQGTYYWVNIRSNPDLMAQTGAFLLRHTGNDKDFLSTRVSHVFDLTGPSVNVQTACSTSLVAIHYAVQALLGGECDMALAGGVTIELPQLRGYLFKEGEILSPDGHCHAFDHRAQGTVFGSGAGCVVLRRLSDAIRDGDHIWAVIKGTAVNNDGAAKAGYLAPSVDGQAAAIAEAHIVAATPAQTIDYIECHGTGTYLGDPIEVAALTEAFRKTTDAEDFCRIGSVKTNIGHTDTAAGVASVIKTALALHHRQMPPSLGYEAPNPAIGFDGSPLRVNDMLTPWPERAHPPRAGVNSLGVGGTNAHAVLQAAPARGASDAPEFPFHLFTLSARSKSALAQAGENLAKHLTSLGNPSDADLADIAWTLHKGRRAFDRRAVVVARDADEAARLLRSGDSRKLFTHYALRDPDAVFMFPGGGAQYAGMARDLYETEPVFRDWMDRGLAVLQPKLDYDIRALWLPKPENQAQADKTLLKPSVQLPLIMITEYALAQLWMAWGVAPAALIGHSMGENTAACLAGVMSFEDCIGLVHLRGQLFDTVPAGGMLSVPLSEAALMPYLTGDLDLASVNAPQLCVASGPDAALEDLALRLKADGIDAQRIAIDIAAHSRMLDPILERFEAYLRSIPLHAPHIPLISNRSGTFLTEAEATDPAYWVAHLRGTVRFLDGLTTLSNQADRIFIEVGPGRAMASLAGQHGVITPNQTVHSLRHPQDLVADDAFFLSQLGRIWALGGRFDWDQYFGPTRRLRVPLPTYPFQRAPYFIAPREGAVATVAAPDLTRIDDITAWGSVPAWVPHYPQSPADPFDPDTKIAAEDWLIFADDILSPALAARVQAAGGRATLVRAGDAFTRHDDGQYTIAAELAGDYDKLWADLAARDRLPARIVHLWHVTHDQSHRAGSSFFHRLQEQGFWSLLHLAQAIGPDAADLHLLVAQNGAAALQGETLRDPAKATAIGPARVIPREFAQIRTAVVDLPTTGDALQALWAEALLAPAEGHAAWRNGLRFARVMKDAPLPAGGISLQGPVLITGGFGGMGLALAGKLVSQGVREIALLGRRRLPPRAEWDDLDNAEITAIRSLESQGARILPLSGDVASLDDMRAAITDATTAFGPIKGLIHAAGSINDAPILGKSALDAEGVLAPKVHGTQVLWSLLPDLSWAALCASTSTVSAPVGQVDYVAANAFLNAFAEAHDRPDRRVAAVNWGIWAEVGMTAGAIKARDGAPQGTPIRAAMLDRMQETPDGRITFSAIWDQTRWFIDEHRTKAGDALLPGTGYLELVAEAMAALGEDLPFTLQDLTFLAPLRIDGPTDLRLILTPAAHGYGLRVETGDAGLIHAEGEVVFDTAPRPAALDLQALKAALPAPEEGHGLRAAQEAHLAFGPRWRTLMARSATHATGLARLSLPATGAEGMHLHPGLMDFATGWAMEHVAGYTPDRLWVPLSYGLVRVFAPLTATIYSHVAIHPAGEGRARFDITLTDETGAVLLGIRDFTMQRLNGAIAFAAPVAKAPRPLSPAEERLRANLAKGIRPSEGAEAFLRAMALGKPQVVVSSLPLAGLVAEASAREEAGEAQTFARPDLDSVFTPPDGEVETRLAGYWAELLGIGEVGAEDGFFDLGGHSLIAVRLMAMVKKGFGIDLPISVLFEAPTIRRLAGVILQSGYRPSDGTATDEPVTAAPRFTHIVPMHQGNPPVHATPFFLVSGMFGNVMNLRQLGLTLGQDRAVYGLQARGLYGDAAPHDDLVAAARDMITEIRQVQPEGPYLLGGFSGGGITAYEIARQMKALGQEVADVILLDTPLARRRPLSRADRMMIKLQEIREGGILWPARWIAGKIRYRMDKSRPKAEAEGTQFHNAAIEAAFYRAIAIYETHPWDGPVALYRPAPVPKWRGTGGSLISDERSYMLPDNDWGQYVPALSVSEVPGDHDSMVLEPHVRALSRRIRTRLAGADSRRKRSQNRRAA